METSVLLLLLILAALLVGTLAALLLAGACLFLVGLLLCGRPGEKGDEEVWVPIDGPGGETWVPFARPKRGPPGDRKEAER